MPVKSEKKEITNDDPIVNIEFSGSGNLMAISYDS